MRHPLDPRHWQRISPGIYQRTGAPHPSRPPAEQARIDGVLGNLRQKLDAILASKARR